MVNLLEVPGLGYLLVALGVVLLLVEASMPGFFVGVPATILVLLGIFALVVPDINVFTQWAPVLALAGGVPATFATIWLYRRMAPPDEEPTTKTASNLVGLEGLVTAPVTSETARGKVKLQHETWSAMSESGVIPLGARVRVRRVDGVILVVEPVQPVP